MGGLTDRHMVGGLSQGISRHMLPALPPDRRTHYTQGRAYTRQIPEAKEGIIGESVGHGDLGIDPPHLDPVGSVPVRGHVLERLFCSHPMRKGGWRQSWARQG